ncbi:MAG: molybdenum cofactor biosynthesis protein MoaE [Woeseiaceae bacterium]|nr:molybdenum cofactor biosynthesis protein MoaE [Woeseiaceae bacterium]
MFAISNDDIAADDLREQLKNPGSGGVCVFEGWVRNENEGRTVLRLEYEVYEPLAITEGEKVIAEAQQQFPFLEASCVHRSGLLEIGDCAVWVGVSAKHRDEAFKACRYIIDEIKIRLPIWKKEYYVGGDSGWVVCERCAKA